MARRMRWFHRKPLTLPYTARPVSAGPLHFSPELHTAAELMASKHNALPMARLRHDTAA